MKSTIKCMLITGFLVLGLSNALLAAEPLESRMEAFRVLVDAEGRERLVTADAVEPGELVEYQMTYTNVSSGALQGLAVTGPVPDGTAYVAGTAATRTPHEFLVSIDGGSRFEPEPVKRKRRQPDGSEREEVIPPDAYTHVRWLTEGTIEAGQAQVYRYRVRIR